MHIEQFYDVVPLERLQHDLVGREVVLELLVVDTAPSQLQGSEERYLARFPNREPDAAAVRDFIARHFTPLLMVWNKGMAGLEPRPTMGLEDALDPGVRLFSLKTGITCITAFEIAREGGPALELISIETQAGLPVTFPRHSSNSERTLSLTIAPNATTRQVEYAIRFYSLVLVVCVPQSKSQA